MGALLREGEGKKSQGSLTEAEPMQSHWEMPIDSVFLFFHFKLFSPFLLLFKRLHVWAFNFFIFIFLSFFLFREREHVKGREG